MEVTGEIMIENNIAIIANYFWKESIKNISETLSDVQMSSFNMNDYYYLTEIYQLGKPKLGELATRLNLTKPAISALTRRLESNQLIIKTQSEQDRRVYFLSLTDKGVKIIRGDNELYSQLSSLFDELLPKDQINMVENLLEKVVERLIKQ